MQLADFASQRMLKNNGLRSRSYLFSSLSLGLFAESRSLSNLFFSRNFSNTKRSFIFLPALLLSLRFSSTSEVFIRLALIFLLILLFFEMRTDRAADGRAVRCKVQLLHTTHTRDSPLLRLESSALVVVLIALRLCHYSVRLPSRRDSGKNI